VNFLSPSRPRLASGLPCWLTAPRVALPHLALHPLDGTKWELQVMINGSWKTHIFQTAVDMMYGLEAWRESPEAFALEKLNTVASGQTVQAPTAQVTIKKIDAEEAGI
jgi:hypothetical protein